MQGSANRGEEEAKEKLPRCIKNKFGKSRRSPMTSSASPPIMNPISLEVCQIAREHATIGSPKSLAFFRPPTERIDSSFGGKSSLTLLQGSFQ